VSEASYTAWDDNLYAWPPPEGWYQASDGRWWPAGYGPAERSSAPEGPAPAAEAAAVPGADGPDPYDQRTSAIPAGGLAAAAAPGPVERAEAETRRRVFDELPPIDDVFGGIDPYADDEEAMPPTPPTDASDDGELPAAEGGPPGLAGNGSLISPPVVPPSPSSLLGGTGIGNGSAPPADSPAFDEAVTVFAPSSSSLSPPSHPEPVDDDPTGPMAGSPATTPDPSPARPASGAGPARPPVEEWAAATTILPRGDDSATTQLDLDALAEADRAASGAGASPVVQAGQRAGGWGADADWPDDEDRAPRPFPAERPAAAGGGAAAFHREQGGPDDGPADRAGGYGDVGLGDAPAPRRWWPLVAIGLAVLVAAASIGGYFLLRDDSQSAATNGGDPAGEGGPPGSFASPYPFGKVVVVYYNDEATGEQRRWVIQVLAPVADATEQLVGAGTASAPGQGEVLALARVRITYQSGPEPGSLSDLRFKAVGGAPGTVFDAAAACPAGIPLDEAAQVEVLASAEGELCWRVPQAELATLKLAVEAEAADGTVHMELNAPAGG